MRRNDQPPLPSEAHPADGLDVKALRDENRRWLKAQAERVNAEIINDALAAYVGLGQDDLCRPINGSRNGLRAFPESVRAKAEYL